MKNFIKIICLCLVIITLTTNENYVKKSKTSETLVSQNQLGFFYDNIHVDKGQLVLTAYLSNGYEVSVYPNSLYLKIYDEDTIYAEDTFLFPKNFFIESSEMRIVTIRFLMNEDVNYQNINQSKVYYQYYLIENPIEV